jgi:glycosyltransferase involved in cell wall biosynthesis
MQNISVIIPCFNAAATLERAVESCLAQPEAVEIIVVDDASTDDSAEIAARLASRDQRVVLHRMDKNGGPARARNRGARLACQPLLSFLDADDEYLPDALSGVVKNLADFPLLPAVSVNIEFAGFPKEFLTAPEFKQRAAQMSSMVPSALTIRRAVFFAFGGFPEDDVLRRFGGEDCALSFAVFSFRPYPRLNDRKRVRMHYHPNSHVAKYFARTLGDMRASWLEKNAVRHAVEHFAANAVRAVRLCYNRPSPPRSLAMDELLVCKTFP